MREGGHLRLSVFALGHCLVLNLASKVIKNVGQGQKEVSGVIC